MPSRLKVFRLGDTYGGLVKHLSPHVIPNNASTLSNNFVVRKHGLETAKGWEQFTSQVLTDGAASPTNSSIFLIDQFFLNGGTEELLAFTDSRVYRFNETGSDLWMPITPGTKSATTVDAASGVSEGTPKVLNVTATTGYSVGDTILIDEDGTDEEGVVDTIQAGVSLTLLDDMTNDYTNETVRRTYAAAVVDSNSAAAQAVLNVSHTDQFSAGEQVIVGLGTTDEEILTIDTIQAGVSLTMTSNLTIVHNAADTFSERQVYRFAEFTLAATVADVDTDSTQNVYYFTDGVNAVQKWLATGDPTYHQPLPGIGSVDEGVSYPDVEGLGTITSDVKAKYLRAFEGFIVLGHTTEQGTAVPQKLRWSRLDNFESWVNETDGTGQAGFFTFESSDWIMGLHQLKRELLVYRERSIEAMSYLGEPDIFGFRRAEMGTGLVAPNALVDFGDSHVFVGPDNIWQYNGISLLPIGDPIKDEFFDAIDPSQLGNVKAFFIEEKDEIWFSYSTTSSRVHDQAYVFNSQLRKWSGPRDVDATGFGYYRAQGDASWDNTSGAWDDSTAIWNSRVFLSNAPINMMGNNDGLVFKVDEIGTKDGSTISKRYESKLTDLGVPDKKKRVQRVRLGFKESSSGTASVYLGWASSAGDSITWVGPQTFNPTNNADPFVFFDETALYFKVRVDTDDTLNLRDVEFHSYIREFR